MNLTIMGSVNSYTKTMKLQTQWQIKQKNAGRMGKHYQAGAEKRPAWHRR